MNALLLSWLVAIAPVIRIEEGNISVCIKSGCVQIFVYDFEYVPSEKTLVNQVLVSDNRCRELYGPRSRLVKLKLIAELTWRAICRSKE